MFTPNKIWTLFYKSYSAECTWCNGHKTLDAVHYHDDTIVVVFSLIHVVC